MLIKNGLVHDAINSKPYKADILIVDGKIAKIAKKIETEDVNEVLVHQG